MKIIVECVAALVAFMLGAVLDAPAMKEITWAGEMSRR
jgi:hypothetical protein